MFGGFIAFNQDWSARLAGRRFLFLISFGSIALGQFTTMSTDYDGQRLLFTTNLSQTGSGQPPYGKLFIADWRGVTPLLIYSYGVTGADLTSDGAYLSVVASSGTGGQRGPEHNSIVYDSSGKVALNAPGVLTLSAHGKRAIATDYRAGFVPNGCTLYDMTTGASHDVSPRGSPTSCYNVADDGTVLASGPLDNGIYRDSTGYQPIQNGAQPALLVAGSLTIDPAGSVVVWAQTTGIHSNNPGIYLAHTSDLTKPVPLGINGWSDTQPRLSDDGKLILFLSTLNGTNNPQVFLMNIDGTNRHPVTSEPEGIAQAVLSGNGQVAWAQTMAGRLLKFDLNALSRTQYTEPWQRS